MTRHATGRALTAAERALAAEMFGRALDGDRVRLHRARWWRFQPANVVMAPDGDIWVPREGGLWREDYATAPLHLQALFVHELTHCWQVQRGGALYLLLMRHPFCRYGYRFGRQRPFHRYGIEQQAELVAHAFLARRGRPRAGAPDLAALDRIIPFGRAAPAGHGTDRGAADRA